MAIRLAVCVSGGGTTLQNLIDRIGDGRLDAKIAIVIASNAQAGAMGRAERAGIPAVCISPKMGVREFSDAVFAAVRDVKAELVVLAGFLSLLRIPSDFAHRVINIHPALIPAFCGKGYYGQAVHRKVLEAGVKITGCTVHFADNEYDAGPIILQRAVTVEEGDTPQSLQERVFGAEREALPEAIRLYAAGRLQVSGRVVRVLPPHDFR